MKNRRPVKSFSERRASKAAKKNPNIIQMNAAGAKAQAHTQTPLREMFNFTFPGEPQDEVYLQTKADAIELMVTGGDYVLPDIAEELRTDQLNFTWKKVKDLTYQDHIPLAFAWLLS